MKKTNIIIIALILIAAAIIIPLLIFSPSSTQKQDVNDFITCVDAGNPVMESYPRRCRNNDITYIEDISNDNTPLALSNYFMEQIRSKGEENLGAMPIEGFNPELYKIAFPNLQDSDFDNTAAISGKWKFNNNNLEFIRSSEGYVTSGDGTIQNNGLITLLENLSNRLGISSDSKSNIDLIIESIEG